MPRQKHQTTISSTDTKHINSRFLNPKDDFGFKHIFTKHTHTDLLIHFLNAVFKGDKVSLKSSLAKQNTRETRRKTGNPCLMYIAPEQTMRDSP